MQANRTNIAKRLILVALATSALAGCGERSSDWTASHTAAQMRSCIHGNVSNVERCYEGAYERVEGR